MSETLSQEQLEQKIQSEISVAVYFYADNCNACLSLRPKIKELFKDKFLKTELLLVNSQKASKIAAQFNAFSVPLLIVFFEGKEFKRYNRYIGLDQLYKEVSRPYQMLFGEE